MWEPGVLARSHLPPKAVPASEPEPALRMTFAQSWSCVNHQDSSRPVPGWAAVSVQGGDH